MGVRGWGVQNTRFIKCCQKDLQTHCSDPSRLLTNCEDEVVFALPVLDNLCYCLLIQECSYLQQGWVGRHAHDVTNHGRLRIAGHTAACSGQRQAVSQAKHRSLPCTFCTTLGFYNEKPANAASSADRAVHFEPLLCFAPNSAYGKEMERSPWAGAPHSPLAAHLLASSSLAAHP